MVSLMIVAHLKTTQARSIRFISLKNCVTPTSPCVFCWISGRLKGLSFSHVIRHRQGGPGMTGALKIKAFIRLFYSALFISVLSAFPVSAQDTASSLPTSLQQDSMEKLVSDLDPDQVEALADLMVLLQQSAEAKTAKATATDASPSFIEQVQSILGNFGSMIVGHLLNLPNLASGFIAGINALFSGSVAGPLHLLLGSIALILAAGFAAEFLFNRIAFSKREAIQSRKPESLFETIKIVSSRAGLDLGGLIVFALVALIAARLGIFDPTTREFALKAVFWIVFLPRLIAALLRFALAPHRSDLRLVTADDATAKSLYRSFTILFAVVGIVFFNRNVMQAANVEADGTFRFFVGFGINAWIIAIIWQARRGLTNIILGDDDEPTSGLERMAKFWPYFSMAFIAFNWLLIQLAAGMGIEALTPGRSLAVIVLVIFAPFLDTMVRGIVSHIVPPMQGEGPVAEAAHMQTRHSYVRIARVALLAFLTFVVARIYSLNLLALGGDGGSTVARNSVVFLLILAAGYLAWEITNLWVSQQLAKDSPPTESQDDDAEMGGAGKSGSQQFSPLFASSFK